MPVWRVLLASCLVAPALLATEPVRADTAVAALDLPRPTSAPPELELDCLALNIYWEARSESLLGQVAVAAVTLNRVAAAAFPDTVCEVVFQGEERGRHLCQFSWRCDGRADEPRNLVAWAEAQRVARLALDDQITDPTGGALWYHAAHVLPAWAKEMSLRARIGHHLFYVRDDAPAPAERHAVAASLPPGPVMALATTNAGDLRIDLEPDPALGLLLCAETTLCAGPAPHLDLSLASPPVPGATAMDPLQAGATSEPEVPDAAPLPASRKYVLDLGAQESTTSGLTAAEADRRAGS